MTGLFGSLGTATRGMNTNQLGLQTSGHNIANINTDGYSRQRVHIQAERPYYMAGVGSIGMGAKAKSVDRIVDSFIRTQTNDAYSKFRFFEQKSDALGQLEHFMNEPSETGIINQLSVMYDSWAKLASNPELATSKTLVIENSNTFTDMINQMASQMKQLRGETLSNVEKSTLDLNQKVEQLAELNNQIFAIASNGTTPNDLLDTRDSLLKDIAGLADTQATFDRFGRVSELKLGDNGVTILDIENGAHEISVETNNDVISIVVGSEEANVVAGEIGGFKEAANEIKMRLGELDTFVKQIAGTINEEYYKATSDEHGENGKYFFDQATINDASALKVSSELRENPSKLQAGKTAAPGDGELAREIGRLFSEKDEAFNNMTFAENYNNIVTRNGISKQQADNTAAAQLTLLNQLEYKNESVSGVNINEEVSDVIRFSQAFQANARVIQTISEMLDTLINRTGV
jgi:flagellar hook-associated protein 1 FlgK